MNPLTYFLLGILLGAIAMWVFFRLIFMQNALSKSQVSAEYVRKEIHESALNQSDLWRDDAFGKGEEIGKLKELLGSERQKIVNLEEKIQHIKQEMQQLQTHFQQTFEQTANKVLDEKAQKFSEQNEAQLSSVLQPLKEKIKDFEANIDKKYLDEANERFSLKKEIEQLRQLNTQLSNDAHNLASALKGDSKTQGDWGEWQLETILQKAGLLPNLHYLKQASYKNALGNELRPDFIINLPDEKHLVVDAKVSLKHYEQYFNAEQDQHKWLRLHLDSLRQHVRDLSQKDYTSLHQINSPDYLLMFVPIEPALAIALQNDQQLFSDALERNIVIVSPSTLLATMRTIAFIWRQEKQKRNVLEIARQSGLLYDKFCAFVEDLKYIGKQLDEAKNGYDAAFNKLSDSKKYGDTLLGRVEKIKQLGAKTSKSLPAELLPNEEEEQENYLIN